VRTIDPRREPVVCLVAGSVGQVRLIDNMEA
jgi:pantothenate synthetase